MTTVLDPVSGGDTTNGPPPPAYPTRSGSGGPPPAERPERVAPSGSQRRARQLNLREVVGVSISVIGVLLVGYVLFQLVVTPMIAERSQRELAGELQKRVDTAAAIASGGAGLAGNQGDFVFGDLDLDNPLVADVVGEVPADAIERLETLGFEAALSPEPSRDLIPGLVTRTVPAADERFAKGETVTVFVATLAPGAPVATLSIEPIGLSQIVVEGTSGANLMEGPGHYRDSPVPGQPGNSVIFGRRTTYGGPFAGLDLLEKGDEIQVGTLASEFTYKVIDTKTVATGDDDVLVQDDRNLLTLVTSNPQYQASEQLVVVAELEGDPVGVAAAAADEEVGEAIVMTPDELGIEGDRTAWAPALLWAELLAVGILVTRRLLRRWTRTTAWLLMGPPIALCAVLFFESANRLLPATL